MRKFETSKSCVQTRCSTQEYVAHNYILHKVLKSESRKKAPRLRTMPETLRKPKTQQTRAIFISFSFQQQHGEGKSEQGHHRRDRECSKCIIIAMILTILSFYPQNAESYSSLSYAVHHRGALRTRRPSLYNASRLGPRHSGAR